MCTPVVEEEITVSVGGRTYQAVIYRDRQSGWWIGRCLSIRGCVTQGRDRAELEEMLQDAIGQCLAAGVQDQPD